MDPGETRRHAGLAGSSGDADGTVTEVVSLLRQAVAALDRMWHEALLSAAPQAVMGLGEASHSVHRALIALSQPDRFEASVEVSRNGRTPVRLSA